MGKSRLEAFSDAIIAIAITIMVLELKVPQGASINDVLARGHVFGSYIISFVFLGIYWNNHHHLLQAINRVDGGVLWANLHLLFWLSLVPFVTGFMGENSFAPIPVCLYGIVMLCAAIAYYILTKTLVALHGKQSKLGTALGRNLKEKLSLVLYVAAILLSFVFSWASVAIYVIVSIIWLVPDRRIEKTLN